MLVETHTGSSPVTATTFNLKLIYMGKYLYKRTKCIKHKEKSSISKFNVLFFSLILITPQFSVLIILLSNLEHVRSWTGKMSPFVELLICLLFVSYIVTMVLLSVYYYSNEVNDSKENIEVEKSKIDTLYRESLYSQKTMYEKYIDAKYSNIK